MNKPIHPAVAEHVMQENEKLRGLLVEVAHCLRTSDEQPLYWEERFASRIYRDLSQQAEPKCSTCNDVGIIGHSDICPDCADTWKQQAEPTDTFTAVDMATAAAQGFRDGQAAVEPAPEQDELWAVHAQGPDELYAAFSRADAEQHAAALNALPMPDDIHVSAVVIVSPWSAAEHWKYLAEQEREHATDLRAIATRPAQTEQQPIVVPEDFQPLETIRWWISAYTNPENGPSYQGHGMMVQMLCEYEALRIMLSSRAQQWPTAYPHEAMDKLATDRYRVGSAGAGTLHRYAVRAGDGEQELYRGSESDCQNVARKLAGAFLDGGLAFKAMLAAPIAQTEQQPEHSGLVEAERDRLLSDNASLRGSCKALGEENKQLKRENKRQGRTIAAMAAKEA